MTIPDYERPSPKKERLVPVLLWVGLAVLVVGVGPLLSIVVAAKMGWTSDPNPNPVGPGILAFFTLWPGIGLTVAGIIITATRWLRRRNRGG